MKIDLVGAFKVLNEIYLVRKMTIAERILIRQKKDLISYLAIHFWSIVKALIVISGLVLLTQFPDQVPIRLFWVYFLTGFVFLVLDSLGIKALLFFIKKFFSTVIKMFVNWWTNNKTYFIKVTSLSRKYKVVEKMLFWTIMIVFFPILQALYFIGFGIVVGMYGLIFVLLVLNGNEALSLLIMNSIARLLPLENNVVLYVFYGVSVVAIYLAIDYRIWMTEGSLVNKETKTDGHKQIIGLKLLNSNNKISIYSRDTEFYVLNNDTDILTVFEAQNRLNFKEKEITDWFNKKKNHNKDGIDSGEQNE